MKLLGIRAEISSAFRSNANRIVICNSFFGLDKPCSLPPNVNLVGPLVKQSEDDMMKNLREKDPVLFEWVEEAANRNEKIIYITIGSECIWQ